MNIAADEKLDLTIVTKRDESISTFSDQDQKIFQVLHDVVQPGQAITPDAAAEQINQHLRSLPGRSEDQQKDTEAVEDFVDSVWSLLTSIAENTPYNHPGQDRLIDFMQALVQKSEGNYSFWGRSSTQLWAGLPLFGPCVREKWNWSATPDFKESYTKMPGASKWINMNSFVARLNGAGIVKWEEFAIWALRQSFEEPFSTTVENDINAVIAAQWIFYAGKFIYNLSLEESPVENPRITKPGSIFDGESGFSVKRWTFWKERGIEISQEVSDEARDIAIAVVEKMSDIEAGK